MTDKAFPRAIALQGASNFRDLGGYAGRGGARVRWRRVFRSDHLGELTPQDLRQLHDLGLARVLDFRGQHERAGAHCTLPGVAVHSLPIEPTVAKRLLALRQTIEQGERTAPMQAAEAVALMQETYRHFILKHTAHFRSFFVHLLDNDAPLVFHCTAGKDRTGLAAALLLRALGVGHEAVVQDYLLTNTLLKTRYTQSIHTAPLLANEALDVINRVEESFLVAAFETIDAEWGSVQAYLAQGLGLGPHERTRLEALYLI